MGGPDVVQGFSGHDHAEFNKVFDRFAEANRASTPSPAEARPGKEIIEKILRSKELQKDAASTERAGMMRGNRASISEDKPTGIR